MSFHQDNTVASASPPQDVPEEMDAEGPEAWLEGDLMTWIAEKEGEPAPSTTPQGVPQEMDDGGLEAALNSWFDENEASTQAPATSAPPPLEVAGESASQVRHLQAALDSTNVALQWERAARAEAEVAAAGEMSRRDEKIRDLEDQLAAAGREVAAWIETARTEGFEAGCAETRQVAEVRHQEVTADVTEQLADANSRAALAAEETAQQSARYREMADQASARSSLDEVQHASQISRYRELLDDAHRLAAEAKADKLRISEKASMLEAHLKAAQVDLELAARHLKAKELAEAELARLTEGQIALLQSDLERERSESKETKLAVDKLERLLSSSRTETKRRVAELTGSIEREKGGRMTLEKARADLAKRARAADKTQLERIARLTAQLAAAERATPSFVPALSGVEHTTGLFAFAIPLAVAALLFVSLLAACFLTKAGHGDMSPCGTVGGFFTLCRMV